MELLYFIGQYKFLHGENILSRKSSRCNNRLSSLSKLDESSDSIDSVSQDSSWDEASISSEISQMKRETFHQVQ